MDIGTLTGGIELEDTLGPALESGADKAEIFADQVVAQFSRAELAGKTLFEQIGKGLSWGVTAPLVAAGAAAIASSMELSGAMTQIQRSTGATGDELAMLDSAFKNVWVSVPQGAGEVASVISVITKKLEDLNLSGAGLEDLTRKFMDFAEVNRVDVVGATSTVITMMRALEIPTEEVGMVMDKLSMASQISGASVTELAQGLIQGGMAMGEMGFKFDKGLALFTKFKQVGANITDVTTSLGQAMSKLREQGVTDLNAGFSDLITRIKDAPTYVQAFDMSVSTFGAKAGRKLAEEIYFGTYAVDEMAASFANADGIVQRMKGIPPLTEQLTLLRKEVSLAIAPVGTQLVGALTALIPPVVSVVRVGADLITLFTKLPQWMQTGTLAVLALAAALGPAILLFEKIGRTVLTVGTQLGYFTVATTTSTVATEAATVATSKLTIALNILRTTTIIGLFVALGAAIWQVAKAVGNLIDVWKSGGSMWEFFTAKEDDNFARRWLGWSKGANAAAAATDNMTASQKQLHDEMTGVNLAQNVEDIRVSISALTEEQRNAPETIEKFGSALKRLQEEGGKLHPISLEMVAAFDKQTAAQEAAAAGSGTLAARMKHLQDEAYAPLSAEVKKYITIADNAGDSEKKILAGLNGTAEGASVTARQLKVYLESTKDATKATDKFGDSVRDMVASFRGADDSLKTFEASFKQLSQTELENYDVLKRVVPEIEKYVTAGGQLTPALTAVLDAEQRIRLERVESGSALLAQKNVTLDYINYQKELGVSEVALARQFGVTVDVLQAYSKALGETGQHLKEQAAIRQREVERQAAAQNAGMAAVVAANAERDALLAARDLSPLENQEAQIKRWLQGQLDAYQGDWASWDEYQQRKKETAALMLDAVLEDQQHVASTSKKALGEQLAIAQKTYALMTKYAGSHSAAVIKAQAAEVLARERAFEGLDVNWNALDSKSRLVLGNIADTAYNTWRYATENAEIWNAETGEWVTQFSDETIAAFKLVADQAAKDAARVGASWKEHLGMLGTVVSELGSAIDGMMGNIIGQAGQMMVVLQRAQQMALTNRTLTGNARTAGIAGSLIGGAAGVLDATSQGSATERALGGAMSGAAAGAMVGTYLAPGTMGVSIAIGAVIGLATGLIRAAFATTEYEKRVRAAAETMTALRKEIAASEGGYARLAEAAHIVGIDLSTAFNSADPEFLKKTLEDLQRRTETLNNAMQEYGFTWRDLGDRARQFSFGESAAELLKKFQSLTTAGIPETAVFAQMGPDFNAMIISAQQAGVKIPEAFRPVLESFIQSGNLSRAAADAIMGIATTAMPALEDIRGAAERYGITLDELGPKVKQLEITELADQYVTDWKILTAATDDWGVLFDKMGPKVQDLIDDAMKYGSELPANMRPMIEAFVEAGQLVDENGDKLTDLSGLTFAADLSEMFADLILKLDDLILKITDGVGGALTDIGRRVVRPRIEPEYVPPGGGPEGPESNGPPVTITMNIDGRTAARTILPHLPEEVELSTA